MVRWQFGPKTLNTRDVWRHGGKLIRKGKNFAAEEVIQKAAASNSPIDRHYAYLKLILLYQKMISEGTERHEELINICRQDVELYPEFNHAWIGEYLNNVTAPYFPSFAVLAQLYEEQGKIAEAISLCELALGYGLRKTSGEDYPQALERLYQKHNRKTYD